MSWFDWMTNHNLIGGRNTNCIDVNQRIWLTDQSKAVKEYEMICDWFANRECLFQGKSSIKKKDVLGLNEKRDSISEPKTRTEASPAKASLSESLRKIERLLQPNTSIARLSNKTSDNFHIYLYIVTLLWFSK